MITPGLQLSAQRRKADQEARKKSAAAKAGVSVGNPILDLVKLGRERAAQASGPGPVGRRDPVADFLSTAREAVARPVRESRQREAEAVKRRLKAPDTIESVMAAVRADPVVRLTPEDEGLLRSALTVRARHRSNDLEASPIDPVGTEYRVRPEDAQDVLSRLKTEGGRALLQAEVLGFRAERERIGAQVRARRGEGLADFDETGALANRTPMTDEQASINRRARIQKELTRKRAVPGVLPVLHGLTAGNLNPDAPGFFEDVATEVESLIRKGIMLDPGPLGTAQRIGTALSQMPAQDEFGRASLLPLVGEVMAGMPSAVLGFPVRLQADLSFAGNVENPLPDRLAAAAQALVNFGVFDAGDVARLAIKGSRGAEVRRMAKALADGLEETGGQGAGLAKAMVKAGARPSAAKQVEAHVLALPAPGKVTRPSPTVRPTGPVVDASVVEAPGPVARGGPGDGARAVGLGDTARPTGPVVEAPEPVARGGPGDKARAVGLGDTARPEGSRRRSSIEWMDPNKIVANPRLQYKTVFGPDGTGQALKDIDVFDVDQAGAIGVFERLDGTREVFHGFHRTNLAKRARKFVQAGVDGRPSEVPREVQVRVLREADGWTERQVRAIGAIENLRNGDGTALDAAMVMRELGIDAKTLQNEYGVSMKGALARDTFGLMRLPDNVLEAVRKEDVPEWLAAGVGSVDGIPAQNFWDAIRKARDADVRGYDGARTYGQVYRAGLTRNTQKRLFEDDDLGDQLIDTTAQQFAILNGVEKAIKGERRMLNYGKLANELEGEVIDKAQRARLLGEFGPEAALKERLDWIKERDEVIMDEVARLARGVQAGETALDDAVREVKGLFMERLRGPFKDLVTGRKRAVVEGAGSGTRQIEAGVQPGGAAGDQRGRGGGRGDGGADPGRAVDVAPASANATPSGAGGRAGAADLGASGREPGRASTGAGDEELGGGDKEYVNLTYDEAVRRHRELMRAAAEDMRDTHVKSFIFNHLWKKDPKWLQDMEALFPGIQAANEDPTLVLAAIRQGSEGKGSKYFKDQAKSPMFSNAAGQHLLKSWQSVLEADRAVQFLPPYSKTKQEYSAGVRRALLDGQPVQQRVIEDAGLKPNPSGAGDARREFGEVDWGGRKGTFTPVTSLDSLEDALRERFRLTGKANKKFDGASDAGAAIARVWVRQQALRRGIDPDEFARTAFAGVAEGDTTVTEAYQRAMGGSGAPRGATEFLEDGRAVIHALSDPDASTMPHELAHVFMRYLDDNEREVVTAAYERSGRAFDADPKRGMDEFFATSFERYLRDGASAPNVGMMGVFERFKSWLAAIYKSLVQQQTLPRLNNELRAVFDGLLSDMQGYTSVPPRVPVSPVEMRLGRGGRTEFVFEGGLYAPSDDLVTEYTTRWRSYRLRREELEEALRSGKDPNAKGALDDMDRAWEADKADFFAEVGRERALDTETPGLFGQPKDAGRLFDESGGDWVDQPRLGEQVKGEGLPEGTKALDGDELEHYEKAFMAEYTDLARRLMDKSGFGYSGRQAMEELKVVWNVSHDDAVEAVIRAGGKIEAPKREPKARQLALFDPEQDTLFQGPTRDVDGVAGPIWRLRSGRLLETMPGKAMAGSEWRRLFRNSGVTSEEMKWTGLDEFLAVRAGSSVSAEDVARHIEGTAIGVDEFVLPEGVHDAGVKPARPYGWDVVLDDAQRKVWRNGDSGWVIEKFGPARAFRVSVHLATSDGVRRIPVASAMSFDDAVAEAMRWTSWVPDAGAKGGKALAGRINARRLDMAWAGVEQPDGLPMVSAYVHDRTAKGGGRVLLIDRIESPWHETGTAFGYAEDAMAKAKTPGEFDRAMELPSKGPGATTWPEMALKRVLRLAAEEGYDRVAWMPGRVRGDIDATDVLATMEGQPEVIRRWEYEDRVAASTKFWDERVTVVARRLGRQWDVAVEDVEVMVTGSKGIRVPSLPVTGPMRRSVMEGQFLFQGPQRRRLEESPAFKAWFGNSKVVDDEGRPLVVYHGAQRPDRIGSRFLKSRATSGPMAFFTDSPEIASNYSTNKADTSIEVASYAEWFKVSVPGARKDVQIDRAWAHMDGAQRAKAREALYDVGMTDDGRIVREEYGGLATRDYVDHVLREQRGNALAAAVDMWLDGGVLFDQEEKFLEVLRLMGVTGVKMDDPNAVRSGVFPVYLSIKNPLKTSDVPAAVVDAIAKASRRQPKPVRVAGADLWDKRYRDPQEWAEMLKEGEKIVWTSIPDWVTRVLKSFGYDGIVDTGGKMGGDGHLVFIPFEPTQVKSAIGNRGTFSASSPDIRFQGGKGQAGLPEILEEAQDTVVRRADGKRDFEATSDRYEQMEAESRRKRSVMRGLLTRRPGAVGEARQAIKEVVEHAVVGVAGNTLDRLRHAGKEGTEARMAGQRLAEDVERIQNLAIANAMVATDNLAKGMREAFGKWWRISPKAQKAMRVMALKAHAGAFDEFTAAEKKAWQVWTRENQKLVNRGYKLGVLVDSYVKPDPPAKPGQTGDGRTGAPNRHLLGQGIFAYDPRTGSEGFGVVTGEREGAILVNFGGREGAQWLEAGQRYSRLQLVDADKFFPLALRPEVVDSIRAGTGEWHERIVEEVMRRQGISDRASALEMARRIFEPLLRTTEAIGAPVRLEAERIPFRLPLEAYDTDLWKVMQRHIAQSTLKLERARVWGHRGDTFAYWAEKLGHEDRRLGSLIGEVLGERASTSAADRAVRTITNWEGTWQVMSKLTGVGTAIIQVTQTAGTVGVLGIRPYAKALKRLAKDIVTDRHQINRIRRSGAIESAYFQMLGIQDYSQASRSLADLAVTLGGVKPMDTLMRVPGAMTGRVALEEAVQKLRVVTDAKPRARWVPGKALRPDVYEGRVQGVRKDAAYRLLRDWMMFSEEDVLRLAETRRITPEDEVRAYQAGSRTQGRNRASDMPPIFNRFPAMRTAWRFQSFLYNQSKILGWTIKEAAKGNPLPLARLTTAYAALGFVANEARDMVTAWMADKQNPRALDELHERLLYGFLRSGYFGLLERPLEAMHRYSQQTDDPDAVGSARVAVEGLSDLLSVPILNDVENLVRGVGFAAKTGGGAGAALDEAARRSVVLYGRLALRGEPDYRAVERARKDAARELRDVGFSDTDVRRYLDTWMPTPPPRGASADYVEWWKVWRLLVSSGMGPDEARETLGQRPPVFANEKRRKRGVLPTGSVEGLRALPPEALGIGKK